MEVRDIFCSFCKRIIGNGKTSWFWKDFWIGDKPLAALFQRLYNLTFSKKLQWLEFFKKGGGAIDLG